MEPLPTPPPRGMRPGPVPAPGPAQAPTPVPAPGPAPGSEPAQGPNPTILAMFTPERIRATAIIANEHRTKPAECCRALTSYFQSFGQDPDGWAASGWEPGEFALCIALLTLGAWGMFEHALGGGREAHPAKPGEGPRGFDALSLLLSVRLKGPKGPGPGTGPTHN